MAEQTGIDGPHLAAVYHDWMRGSEAEGKPKGEASLAELIAIRDGESPLPAGSRLIIDLHSIPEKLRPEDVAAWPEWRVVLREQRIDGAVLGADTLTVDAPEGSIVRVQAPDRPAGVWQRSLGYRLILIGPEPAQPCALEISATVGSWHAGPLVIPWCSRA